MIQGAFRNNDGDPDTDPTLIDDLSVMRRILSSDIRCASEPRIQSSTERPQVELACVTSSSRSRQIDPAEVAAAKHHVKLANTTLSNLLVRVGRLRSSSNSSPQAWLKEFRAQAGDSVRRTKRPVGTEFRRRSFSRQASTSESGPGPGRGLSREPPILPSWVCSRTWCC